MSITIIRTISYKIHARRIVRHILHTNLYLSSFCLNTTHKNSHSALEFSLFRYSLESINPEKRKETNERKDEREARYQGCVDNGRL